MAEAPRSSNTLNESALRASSSTADRGVRSAGGLSHTRTGANAGRLLAGRSATVNRFGRNLIEDTDEASDASTVARQTTHMGRPVARKAIRGGGKAGAAADRWVRGLADNMTLGKEGAAAAKKDRANKRARKELKKTRRKGRGRKVINAGKVRYLMTSMDRMAVGRADEEAANTTNRWVVSGTSRMAYTAKSAGVGTGKRATRRASHPVRSVRAAARRARRVHHAALRVVRVVRAVMVAMKAMMAAAVSSTFLMVLIAIITVVSIIMSIMSIFTVEDHREKEAAAATTVCGGTGTLKIPARAKPWVAEGAKTSGLPSGFIAAIMNIESSFNPNEVSPAGPGYFGLLQIGYLEVVEAGGPSSINIFDPMQNAHWGGMILKMRLKEAQAAVKKHPNLAKAPITDLVAIGHNAGPGRIPNWTSDGRQLPAETQGYLVKLHKWFTPASGSEAGTCSASGGTVPASAAADRAGWYADLAAHAPGFVVGGNNYVPDSRQFYAGECVSFVGWMLATHGAPGVRGSFTNNWHGTHFGNARQWPAAARAVGITVDQNPAVGAVAEHEHTRNGHVAYITKVYPDKSFDIEQGNAPKHHQFGTRSHARIGREFDHVIHFEKGVGR